MWILLVKEKGYEHEQYFKDIEQAKLALHQIRMNGKDGFILLDKDLV